MPKRHQCALTGVKTTPPFCSEREYCACVAWQTTPSPRNILSSLLRARIVVVVSNYLNLNNIIIVVYESEVSVNID